jgi:CRP/FNR family transcriptional regulator, nitrogen fixation regulation protein
VSLAAAQITLSASRPVRSGLDSTPPFVINGKAPQATFYAEGSELYAQGDRAHGIYQVAFGAVRVFRILADGRRQISAFHLAGEIFGFEASATHRFFAEAICASGVRVFRMAAGADASRELLPLALSGLMKAQDHQLVLSRQSAGERVAAFLLDLAERQGGLESFELPMSRLDIADYLGLTIETVSRTLTRFKAKGIISLPSLRRVEIRRWGPLQQLAA